MLWNNISLPQIALNVWEVSPNTSGEQNATLLCIHMEYKHCSLLISFFFFLYRHFMILHKNKNDGEDVFKFVKDHK